MASRSWKKTAVAVGRAILSKPDASGPRCWSPGLPILGGSRRVSSPPIPHMAAAASQANAFHDKEPTEAVSGQASRAGRNTPIPVSQDGANLEPVKVR